MNPALRVKQTAVTQQKEARQAVPAGDGRNLVNAQLVRLPLERHLPGPGGTQPCGHKAAWRQGALRRAPLAPHSAMKRAAVGCSSWNSYKRVVGGRCGTKRMAARACEHAAQGVERGVQCSVALRQHRKQFSTMQLGRCSQRRWRVWWAGAGPGFSSLQALPSTSTASHRPPSHQARQLQPKQAVSRSRGGRGRG